MLRLRLSVRGAASCGTRPKVDWAGCCTCRSGATAMHQRQPPGGLVLVSHLACAFLFFS